ncbi:hypothetical protein QZH41_003606 [Actinostola sp. cb2023]|nr:hypothetical protein QZH41_003606 [Actinostola sp. cb2023]
MPRKQTRTPSRKRLWFNVVEFDKETGRPLWRNKKSKLDNKLPPCITDPTFSAMLDKLRKETELALNMNTCESTEQMPCSMVWRNNKRSTHAQFKVNNAPKTTARQTMYRNSARYENEGSSPQLVMQFQHFSPLTSSMDNMDVTQQKREIQDFLKMKQIPFARDFQAPVPEAHDRKGPRRSSYTNSEAYVPDSDILVNDWDNTVRLHHVDFDSKPCIYDNSCDFNSDQKVPLAIF